MILHSLTLYRLPGSSQTMGACTPVPPEIITFRTNPILYIADCTGFPDASKHALAAHGRYGKVN